MIRTTYRGRDLAILKSRTPHCVRLRINGQIIHHGWQGTETQALGWFQRLIDKLDAEGGPGVIAAKPFSQMYTATHWWEPGTFDVNGKGHATQPGSVCLCSLCVIADVGNGSKARYAPLHPDACRLCPAMPADHHSSGSLSIPPHFYKEPTDTQRAGRQATLNRYYETDADEPPECGAIYPKDHPSYLARPKCVLSADHREAPGREDWHEAVGGFAWLRETVAS